MTALLALQRVSLTDVVTATAGDLVGESSMGLVEGEQRTVRRLALRAAAAFGQRRRRGAGPPRRRGLEGAGGRETGGALCGAHESAGAANGPGRYALHEPARPRRPRSL